MLFQVETISAPDEKRHGLNGQNFVCIKYNLMEKNLPFLRSAMLQRRSRLGGQIPDIDGQISKPISSGRKDSINKCRRHRR